MRIFLILTLVVFLFGCGGDDDDNPTASTTKPEPPANWVPGALSDQRSYVWEEIRVFDRWVYVDGTKLETDIFLPPYDPNNHDSRIWIRAENPYGEGGWLVLDGSAAGEWPYGGGYYVFEVIYNGVSRGKHDFI